MANQLDGENRLAANLRWALRPTGTTHRDDCQITHYQQVLQYRAEENQPWVDVPTEYEDQ